MSLNKLTTQGANKAALGQAGATLELSDDALTGSFVAIQFLTDTVFTTLTPENSQYIGSASGSGDNVGSTSFVAGMTIYGRWTAITLASGSIIAYHG